MGFRWTKTQVIIEKQLCINFYKVVLFVIQASVMTNIYVEMVLNIFIYTIAKPYVKRLSDALDHKSDVKIFCQVSYKQLRYNACLAVFI